MSFKRDFHNLVRTTPLQLFNEIDVHGGGEVFTASQ